MSKNLEKPSQLDATVKMADQKKPVQKKKDNMDDLKKDLEMVA